MVDFFIGCFMFVFIVIVFVVVTSMIITVKLLRYLKKNHYETWVDLTSYGNMGPGVNNAGKMLSFAFNDKGLDDQKVIEYKGKLKIRYIFLATGMICEIFIFIFMIVSALLTGK